MFTKRTRTKSIIGATIAAAAVPAILFAGAGTAQAASTLNTASDAIGVTVEIHSTGSEGLCYYSAETWFGWTTVKPLLVYKVPFYLSSTPPTDPYVFFGVNGCTQRDRSRRSRDVDSLTQ